MDADARIAAIAARWWGVVHRDQLIQAGLSKAAIARRLAANRLHELHPCVYAVGHRHVEWHGRAYAALLYMGPTAALSHLTAAAIWGLLRQPAGWMHVTVPGTKARGTGVVLHRMQAATTTRQRLRVTTVEETLLVLAATENAPTLQRALNQAEYLRILDRAKLEALAATRRHGAPALRQAMAMAAPTRSGLEDRFYALLREAKVPPPLANWQIGPYQVDFYWPDLRLVIETDGWSHETPTGRHRDRRKDAWLRGRGLEVVHLKAPDLRRGVQAAAAAAACSCSARR